MAKEIKLRGDTPEQKLKHVERILQRFSRRLHKTVVGAIPPIPLFFYTDVVPENGVIFQGLLPLDGVVTNVCLYIDKFVEGSGAIAFSVSIQDPNESRATSFDTKRNFNIDRVNIPVKAGSRLTLSTPSPENISGVWVSFLLEVGVKGSKKEVFLIDEFEKVIDSEVEEDMSDGEQVQDVPDNIRERP